MPQSKHKRESEMPSPQKTSDHPYAGLVSVEGIEAGLRDLGTESVSLNGDSARRDDVSGSEKEFGLQDCFVSKEWHGPYVEAVCGTDEAKREELIAEAERAIVNRFLELAGSAVETDEILDLENAAYAITELKNASAVIYTPQHLVA